MKKILTILMVFTACSAVAQTENGVGDKVQEVAHETAQGVKKVAHVVADDAKKGAHVVATETEKGAHVVAVGAKKGAHAVATGAKEGAHAVASTAGKVKDHLSTRCNNSGHAINHDSSCEETGASK